MNHQEIKSWIESMGYPTAEVCFEESPSSPPFTIWLDESRTIGADGRVVGMVHNITLELYTDSINSDAEAVCEALIEEKRLAYEKESGWIDNARLHVTAYKFFIYERRTAR